MPLGPHLDFARGDGCAMHFDINSLAASARQRTYRLPCKPYKAAGQGVATHLVSLVTWSVVDTYALAAAALNWTAIRDLAYGSKVHRHGRCAADLAYHHATK